MVTVLWWWRRREGWGYDRISLWMVKYPWEPREAFEVKLQLSKVLLDKDREVALSSFGLKNEGE